MEIEKKIRADFFKTEKGNEPVRDFLKALSSEDKKSVGADVMADWLSYCQKIGCRFMGNKNEYFDKRICRIMFTVCENKMLLLHAFVKKTQKTPKEDMELGKKRRNLILGGGK